MGKRILVLCISVCFFVCLFQSPFQAQVPKSIVAHAHAKTTSQLPQLDYFTENKGQWNENILFMGNTGFGRIAFTEKGIWYEIQKSNNHYINLEFVNPLCNSSNDTEFNILPELEQTTVNNYLSGSCKTTATNCKNYLRITYYNIWNGIDLSYFFTEKGLKYEYYVHPKANPSDIRVKVHGATIRNEYTQLHLVGDSYSITDGSLAIFTRRSHTPVKGSFTSTSSECGFLLNCSQLNRNETIVIDPVVYSTFLGGYQLDDCAGVQLDSKNCAYIAGHTRSTTSDHFPIGEDIPGYTSKSSGDYDIFVLKLSPIGDRVLYSTFIGGTKSDTCSSFALDTSNNIVLVGDTLSEETDNFPIGGDIPGFDTTFGGFNEGFLLKLDASGTKILYSTYIGGKSNDYTTDIKLDTNNYMYVSGVVNSSQKSFPIGGDIPGYDTDFNGHCGYVLKLSPSGMSIEYSTYLGGTNFDEIKSLAVDTDKCVYVTGYTASKEGESFPLDGEGFDKLHNGLNDAFVIKLNSTGTKIEYSTYIGGIKNDTGTSITVDTNKCAYVTGYTFSEADTFPVGNGIPGFDTIHGEYEDAFCCKLSPDGNKLMFSTYIGGAGSDISNEIELSNEQEVCISGDTRSNDGSFPVGGIYTSFQYIFGGNIDSFFIKLNNEGTDVVFSTLLGGQMIEDHTYFDVNKDGDFVLVGKTSSTERDTPPFPIFPDLPGYSKRNRGGNGDVFAFRYTFKETVPEIPKPSVSVKAEQKEILLCPGEKALSHITVKNTGEEDSLLEGSFNVKIDTWDTEVEWIKSNRKNFSLEQNEEITTDLSISAEKLDIGKYRSSVIIQTNDHDNPEVKVDITLIVDSSKPKIVYHLLQSSFSILPNKAVSTLLSITNNGEKDSNLIISFDIKANWCQIQPDRSEIQYGDTSPFELTVTSHDLKPGEYTTNLLIRNNDPGNQTVTLPITLTVQEPHPSIRISPNDINLEAIKSKKVEHSIVIENVGADFSNLSCNLYSKSTWIEFNPAVFELNSNESKNVVISCITTDLEPNRSHKTTIEIHSNDPAKPLVQIPVTITVKPIELVVTLQIGSKNATVKTTDGEYTNNVKLDTPPVIINGRTMVPLRFLAETFGAKVAWFGKEEEIQIRYKDMLIHLWLHRKYGRSYDALIERTNKVPEKVSLSSPPCIVNGRTVVPLRFIAETFGAEVLWDGPTQTITLRMEWME